MNPSAAPAASSLRDVPRYLLAIGAMLVLLLPAARGSSEWLGWWPMWLLAMPATALWAVHGFALPGGSAPVAARPLSARRRGPQARRRVRPGPRPAWSKGAGSKGAGSKGAGSKGAGPQGGGSKALA
ncbi:hypothetical protein [Agrilutibacter solisilvae]|uniref:hypothetical protein n=1 Tax=Agrilutibacter solisilvae TaxID=2763317 RepID=UPI0031BB5507